MTQLKCIIHDTTFFPTIALIMFNFLDSNILISKNKLDKFYSSLVLKSFAAFGFGQEGQFMVKV